MDHDITGRSLQTFRVNHVIRKPKLRNIGAETKVTKAEVNFMMDLTMLVLETSVDSKLLQFNSLQFSVI